MNCACGVPACFKVTDMGKLVQDAFRTIFPTTQGACRECFQMVLAQVTLGSQPLFGDPKAPEPADIRHTNDSGDSDDSDDSDDFDDFDNPKPNPASLPLSLPPSLSLSLPSSFPPSENQSPSQPNAPPHGLFFSNKKKASAAARTHYGCFKSTKGNSQKFTCIVEGCESVRHTWSAAGPRTKQA